MTDASALVFGPVASRRLGLSLGVDLVPRKICTLDCIYCEVCRTTLKTVDRKSYVDLERLISEIEARLPDLKDLDYITLTGSGEPTLNSDLGTLIDRIRPLSSHRIAIITNGTLLFRPDVRADCAKADLVMPSLNAADAEAFQRINRPHPEITVGKVIQGLIAFRQEYQGPIWLEVFLTEGVNMAPSHIEAIREAVAMIRPERVQLNTAVRPTADPGVRRASPEHLQAIARQLGPVCEVIADSGRSAQVQAAPPTVAEVLALIRRRPCTLDGVCQGLGLSPVQATELLAGLQVRGLVGTETREGDLFFTDARRP